MAARIHIGTRSFALPADADAQTVAASVRAAVEAKGVLELQVEADGSPVTLFVNTAEVDVIALDWHGTGAGFMHG
jgi:hypothetical protein